MNTQKSPTATAAYRAPTTINLRLCMRRPVKTEPHTCEPAERRARPERSDPGLDLEPLATGGRALVGRRLTIDPGAHDRLDRLHQDRRVRAPLRVVQRHAVAACERSEILGHVRGGRHLRPLDEHRDDADVLAREGMADLEAHEVVGPVQPPTAWRSFTVSQSSPIRASTTSQSPTACWILATKSTPRSIVSTSMKTLSAPKRALSASNSRPA